MVCIYAGLTEQICEVLIIGSVPGGDRDLLSLDKWAGVQDLLKDPDNRNDFLTSQLQFHLKTHNINSFVTSNNIY